MTAERAHGHLKDGGSETLSHSSVDCAKVWKLQTLLFLHLEFS